VSVCTGHRRSRLKRENFCFYTQRGRKGEKDNEWEDMRKRKREKRKRKRGRGERALFPCKVGFINWVAINIAWQLPSATSSQVVVAASSNPSLLSFSSCILHSASCHQPSLFLISFLPAAWLYNVAITIAISKIWGKHIEIPVFSRT